MSWQTVKLGDVCVFSYGKSLPEQQRITGDCNVFGSNGIVGLHTHAFTNNETIVIGRKGSIGKVNWSNNSCWPIDTTYFIDKNNTKENLRWLYWFLSSLGLETMNKSAAVPGLNREDAYRISIKLPPLPEQKRIAAILDKADEIRRKREAAIAKLEQLEQSIFVEMFGDIVSNDRGWQLLRFGEIGTLDRGISKHRPRNAPELLGGVYPLVQTSEVANCDGYIRSYKNTYSEIGLKQSKMWPAGTLCITIAANIAKTGILTFDSCFPDSVVGFCADCSATVDYVRVWLSFLQKTLEDNAPECAQKNINLAILRELAIPFPPITLQEEFSNRLNFLYEVKTKYASALAKQNNLFASLQHQAFNGQL